MSFVEQLVCSKCGTKYEPGDNPVMCLNRDLGRLDIVYDYDGVSERFNRKSLPSRKSRDIWRYEELLPVSSGFAVKLGEGGTPLVHAIRLGERLGMKNLYLKDDTRNPTASFKDRAMAVGSAKAVELKKKDVAIASSGNAAASLAAYSAGAGMKCHAFVPPDASAGKIAQLLLYGASIAKCVQVKKGEDATVQAMLDAVDRFGYYPCPSFGPFNPYQVEGPKTIVYELYEQRDWGGLDAILVPTGSGCLLTGIWKGLRDLSKLDLIRAYPQIVAVQPAGNQALVRAIQKGVSFSKIIPEPYPKSVAGGLLDPYPWDGDAAIAGVRETHGAGVSVSDRDILRSVGELAAYEGIFAEPSGAAGLAGLEKLLSEGGIGRDERVVVLVTGSGLKEPDRVIEMFEGRNRGGAKRGSRNRP
ncbi:MAG TPA: threonine synthase [Nitrososphaerales archaeon]|nr:threonine synthase [Nitrososphaerales archaeon]